MDHSPSRAKCPFLCVPSLHCSLVDSKPSTLLAGGGHVAGVWASCAGGLVRVILILPSAALVIVDVTH